MRLTSEFHGCALVEIPFKTAAVGNGQETLTAAALKENLRATHEPHDGDHDEGNENQSQQASHGSSSSGYVGVVQSGLLSVSDRRNQVSSDYDED